MASNPPFQVEDQTDEDFFDKLVDDDDDHRFKVMKSEVGFVDGSDSDEAKAFANLTIGESDLGEESKIEDRIEGFIEGSHLDAKNVEGNENSSKIGTLFGGDLAVEDVEVKGNSVTGDSVSEVVEGKGNSVAIGETSLVSCNSFDFDGVVESNEGGFGSVGVVDSTVPKSGELQRPGESGVKEVQWSLFHTDSGEPLNNGFGSYSDFFSELGENTKDPFAAKDGNSGPVEFDSSSSSVQSQENHVQTTGALDLNASQYWDNQYPGWRYDPSSGQWYQIDGYDATTNVQGSSDLNSASDWVASDVKSEGSYLQQTAQSVVETVTKNCTTGSVSNWNQTSQVHNGYPEHMFFDPQYPGWYYDTIAQEWRSLETYTGSNNSNVRAQEQQIQNGFATNNTFAQVNDHGAYSGYGKVESYGSQALLGNNNQNGINMWQAEAVAKSEAPPDFSRFQNLDNRYGSKVSSANNYVDQQKPFNSFGTASVYEKERHAHENANGVVGFRGFVPSGSFNQPFHLSKIEQNDQKHVLNDFHTNHIPGSFTQQPFQSPQQISYGSGGGRSSAGRPPHALVTFGFGGKLVVMKDNSSVMNSSFGSQVPAGGSVSILNLVEVVTQKTDASSTGVTSCDYFRALCQQSFPGPLVGGSVGSKELNKWIDERIANCELSNFDYRKGEGLQLLLALLKIACQHYGKLRSPFGTDTALRESDSPESAVAKLFASAKKKGAQFSEYGSLSRCLQMLPSEGQLQATASNVQSLLVSGRKKEALQYAQDGQLWEVALVLAAQLGEQFYVDTVKQMALRQLVAGSPLRTLCLLIAGQPADVFATDTASNNGIPAAANVFQQPAQIGGNGMLDDWEENLAVITANRTKDDELVIIHLGDCLWKERSEITAAHICYLIAEANFEPYSDSARLCLIGADHWKAPRTYASPEAIQRTELYEYSKVLGNSQFTLQPLQPYKLIYAHMLAEVGKLSDALKYCQAVVKSLKIGRTPEVDTVKQLVYSLEERIKTHQQGGYATNPAKLVGKLLTFFDNTAHRVVGGLPPPVPSPSQSSNHSNENYQQMGPRVSNSQSTMAMSSLISSATNEPSVSMMPNRSVSEPDFGRTPRQVDSSKETSPSVQSKASGGTSRFARFGFGSQILQKTVGLVLKPRSDKQAKLGEKNKFYYDEKLKRWVEEGAGPPAEEAALPPPPTTSGFQNGLPDYSLKSAFSSDGSSSGGSPEFKSPIPSEHSSGIPPIPPTSNQFSARGRTSVRSRYVDTFNQGTGNPTSLFQAPSLPVTKPLGGANAKFFVPTPSPQPEHRDPTISDSTHEAVDPEITPTFHSPPIPSQSMTKQRFPSMNNIEYNGLMANGNGPIPPRSRRTASWSGGTFAPLNEVKPLGETLGIPPSAYMPNGGGFGDELHEVEL